MPDGVIDPRRIAAARVHGQLLIDTPHASAAAVVRALGAVQSQDYAGGSWAIAMRSRGLDSAAIDAAFDRGDFVRTHVLRPTWHFVAPEDLRWMQALTGQRISQLMASYNTKLGLTPEVFRKSHRVIEKALAARGPLTRTELKAELDRAHIVTTGTQRLAHLAMQAELDAVVCSGPRKGKQSTYALVDQRIGKSRDLAGDEALHELTLRYFATRSPATAHDFSWWSGLTLAECRRGISMAGKRLAPIVLNGASYWATHDFTFPARIPTAAHLLPNYDEYFIGFRDRSAIGQRMKSHALVTGGNALIAHVVAIDGQLVGGWRVTSRANEVELEFNLPFALTPAERTRVKREVRRFAEYSGRAVEVIGLG